MSKYFNQDPYKLTQNDTDPPLTFVLGSGGTADDFSDYPNMVVTARVRQAGESTSLADITCTHVHRSTGQFQIASWPTAVVSADSGPLEVQISIDYWGDGTKVLTVVDWLKLKLLEEFGSVA